MSDTSPVRLRGCGHSRRPDQLSFVQLKPSQHQIQGRETETRKRKPERDEKAFLPTHPRPEIKAKDSVPIRDYNPAAGTRLSVFSPVRQEKSLSPRSTGFDPQRLVKIHFFLGPSVGVGSYLGLFGFMGFQNKPPQDVP